ncbi:uncharacterized protein AB675_10638 [Cyphellophora attinorum]|uniref:Uncharacterized protein n=1 Tax=Cyphellophora attinorum TaxID=1664694 RepID=A0A0N0NN21_9EURO|nr:uncharacterized protein AB675_10638 [Phialophora attinorum]KPI40879.1 hypothetical protein AB675_10638 [Phialophora attinorum]
MPLSLLDSKEQPSRPVVRLKASTEYPFLKRVCLVCSRLRKIALPHLFRHVLVLPGQLDNLLAFTSTQKLDTHVTTAHIYLNSPSSHEQPPWWAILLDQLTNLTTITVTAPPHIFAEITRIPVKTQDAWAFKIAEQSLQLTCAANSTYAPYEAQASPSLLTARPWHTLHVNESSSLRAYTTYEYFLRTPPSPISPFSKPLSSLETRSAIRTLLSTIRHFHFTAIFPSFNHIGTILEMAEGSMTRLDSLTFQLLPKPNSTILVDALEETGGHIDVNDPWNEFETSLALVAVSALGMSRSNLTKLTMEDVAMEGVRDMIERIVTEKLVEEPDLGWAYEGVGRWRRPHGHTTK